MYRINSPYVGLTSQSCLCSCFNMQYFTTSYGILKIIQMILGSICQSILMFYGTKYIPTFGTSYESFLTTVAGCLMTTTVISVSYLLSKNTEVLVRSSLFEIIFGIFASICYLSSSSLLTIAVYTLLYPIIMTMPFTSIFSAVILAYILGFILGVIYAIDAYWAFKYYKGFS
ncbi:protein singles bar [Metopolophium dirhodum]|uniref:protein singles bar n=1 Tax=Metopolophium dirhodum TaxID=44670 RepID=UPI0029902465|nr:protein singles bar [Metopolophium dirhodum]